MPISAVKLDATAVDLTVTEDQVVIVLADGRELAAPLAWFPRGAACLVSASYGRDPGPTPELAPNRPFTGLRSTRVFLSRAS